MQERRLSCVGKEELTYGPLRLSLHGKMPLQHAMLLIGGKWKVQILCAVCNAGSIRYNALRGKLDGVSNTVLSSALKELERDGLIQRQEFLEVPVRVEYRPTERCRTLLPILEALSDWAEQDMK